ncbi:MAG: SOUL family heme-binding protein, partial [Erysipelotrichaceae bacterium]
MAVETLAYEVKKHDGDFEIRWYPDYQIIENENSDGFDELFRYISGTNQDRQKIAMTAPVLNKLDANGMRSMSFVIPSSIKASQPLEKGLVLKAGTAGLFAVVRVGGR